MTNSKYYTLIIPLYSGFITYLFFDKTRNYNINFYKINERFNRIEKKN